MKRIGVFILLMALMAPGLEAKKKKKKTDLYYYNMGVSYLNKKDPEKAIPFLEKAAKMNPKNFQIFHALGIAYSMLGEVNRAEEYFKIAISLNPAYGPSHNLLGVIYTQKGLYQKAEQEFKKALEDIAYPTKEAVYLNMAKLYLKMGKRQKALSTLDQAIVINKDYSPAYAFKGYIYALQGDYLRAKELYKAALDRDRENGRYWFALAEVLEKLGDLQGAKVAYGKVLVLPVEPELRVKAEERLKKLEK